ncbi:MAG TPA: TaqI-like C-terminal specificity domain-containing protein, partial [Polyangiaceae bacterium]|nr:TaqI-like C-terminal specificity domain-containing protein [Polyangiaceae bacterium]
PTLQGLFVEQAARIAPDGVIALVLPSPVADLEGYAATRRALTARHSVCEPLLEFGQDAFEGVTQPCFALVAEAEPDSAPSARPWNLDERQRARIRAEQVSAPSCVERLAGLPCLPGAVFGEMGFQSTRIVSESLLLRASEPQGAFRFPLLEGRDVSEFNQRSPRLFLNPDLTVLRQAGCRLRDAADYTRVAFVVRQTAKVTIAALHHGAPFRNSLLAGFAHAEYSAPALVALLNSALYRSFHLARQRDARQAAFPQVKIRHLRALPAPPRQGGALENLEALTRAATESRLTPELRIELDARVFALFGVGAAERTEVLNFLGKSRAHAAPLSE